MRHSFDMDISAWPDGSKLREPWLWDLATTQLAGRALFRIVVSCLWLWLAEVAAPGAVPWGVPMLASSAFSYLHARRDAVVAVASWLKAYAPRAARWWQAAFPYPSEPHLNLSGFVELAGLLATGWATGRGGNRFAAQPAAEALAGGLVCAVVASVIVNLSGHPVWEMDLGRAWIRRIRWFLGPAAALVAAAVLWPAGGDGTLRVGVAAGSLLIILSGWAAARGLSTLSGGVDRLLGLLSDDVRLFDAQFVHSAFKNHARFILGRADLISDADLRRAVRNLCFAAADVKSRLDDGRLIRSAQDVVDSLASADAAWAPYRNCVVADVDPHQLQPRDRTLIFITVSDLFTNAVTAGAQELTIAVTAAPADSGSTITVTGFCRCGKILTQPAAGSSLRMLASTVAGRGGGFVVRDDGTGAHTFTVTWPTTATPAALPAPR